MDGYLFPLFLGLRGCVEGYKKALNQFRNILLRSLLLMPEHGFNIRLQITQGLFGLS
jgi:hypothetical protein